MKFATKLTVMFSLIYLITSAIAVPYIYVSSTKTLKAEIIGKLEGQAFHTIDKTDRLFYAVCAEVKTFATDPFISTPGSSREQITLRLLEFRNQNKIYTSFSFFDLNRVRLADLTGKGIGEQNPLTSYWEGISQGWDLAMGIGESASLQKAAIYVAKVVRDKNGNPFAVLVARISLEVLHQLLEQAPGVRKDDHKYEMDLVDKDGLLLYSNHNPKGMLKEKSADWEVVKARQVEGNILGNILHVYPETKEEEILIFSLEQGYLDFPGNGWTLLIHLPIREAFSPARELRTRLIIILLALTPLCLLAIFWFSRGVTRPLIALEQAAAAIGAGDLEVDVPAASRDEVGSLAAAFRNMVGQLKNQQEQLAAYSSSLEGQIVLATVNLRQANEQLSLMLESLPIVTFSYRLNDNSVTYISSNITAIAGYAPKDFIADPNFRPQRIHPEDAPRVMEELAQLGARGRAEMEYRWQVADGTYRWFLDAERLMESGDASWGHVVGVLLDITARKEAEEQLSRVRDELEDKVAERTAALTESNAQLAFWAKELEQRHQEVSLLGRMGDFLQSCRSLEEAYVIIGRGLGQLFPADSGGVYIFSASRNLVEGLALWGEAPPELVFHPDDCWGLRRGQPHGVAEVRNGLRCGHVDEETRMYYCIPLIAQGDTLGILHLRVAPQEPGPENERRLEAKQQLVVNVAEHLSLSLANLRLKAALQDLSVRDPLTGLFNRRYLEESLERELHRARRRDTPLGLIMLDLDHFKQFNDTYGHGAGDALLRELGLMLERAVRASDVACRYGGEEFILLLPDATLESAGARAEDCRQMMKALKVHCDHRTLRTVTVSLGVAVFPEHGDTAAALVQAADAALYRAKEAGRDRVMMAELRGHHT